MSRRTTGPAGAGDPQGDLREIIRNELRTLSTRVRTAEGVLQAREEQLAAAAAWAVWHGGMSLTEVARHCRRSRRQVRRWSRYRP